MKRVKRRTGWWWKAGALTLIGVVVLVGAFFVLWTPPQRAGAPSSNTDKKQSAQPVGISSNALFFGNMYWGRYINDWSMKSPLKTAYPFSRLNEFHRDQYDAWVAGLECPTVAGVSMTSAEEDATLQFNCSPNYLPEAAKWFTAVTLANNHTDNQGAAGFEETKKHLEENRIQYFGHYDPYAKDDACEVIAFPVSVKYDNNETKHQKLPVAMCGFHGVFKIPPADTIAEITKYSQVMPVIAFPHMGVEYTAAPDQLKTATYHALIDAGADMVLGDHPHWTQNTEAYKGKLIVYSMGNFMFDQQDTTEVTRSAAIRVVMNTTKTPSEQLAKWLALGERCASFKDDCLALAKQQSLPKIPFEYRFGVVGTNDADKIVKPATEAQQAALLQRLNWSHTMTGLQPPYASL